jgi:hypothetical protein
VHSWNVLKRFYFNSQRTCTNDLSLLTLVIFQARVMSAFSLMLLSLQLWQVAACAAEQHGITTAPSTAAATQFDTIFVLC